MRSSPGGVHRIRRAGASLVLAAVLVLLTSNPAAAAGPGAYAIVPGTGTFTTLTTNNLAPQGAGGGQVFYLSTTGTGVNRLPFPLHLFNQFYTNVAIGSYGNVQPGVPVGEGKSDLPSGCLPTSTFGKPAIMALWGEVVYGGGSSGIFLRTQGVKPHRTFLISWQGVFAVSAPTTARAQAIFREDSQTITLVYGMTTRQTSVVVGIQSKQQLTWAQRYCDGSGVYPTKGTKLTLNHSG